MKGIVMPNNFDYLNALHTISANAKESEKFLECLIDSDKIPTRLKLKFLAIQETIITQDLVIRRLTESEFEITEALERITNGLTK